MNALRALAARLATLILGFVCGVLTTRLVVQSAGVDGFAFYSMIVALPALIPFTDLGTGALVVNGFARRNRDLAELRGQLRSVMRITSSFAVVVVVVSGAMMVTRAWETVLGSAANGPSVNVIAFVSSCIFAASIPFGVWARVLLGLDRNHVVVLIQGFQAPLALFLVWMSIAAFRESAYDWLVCSVFIAGLVVSLFGFYVADRGSVGLLVEGLRRLVSIRAYPGLPVLHVGLPMMIQMLTPPAATQVGRFIVAQYVSVIAMAQYGLLVQIYVPLLGLVGTVGLTLWPYYARLRETGKTGHNPMKLATLFSLIASISVACLMLVGGWLFPLISDGRVDVPELMILAFGAQLVVQAFVYPLGMYLMDPSGIRFQTLPALFMAIGSILLTALLAPIWGIAAAPLSASIAMICFQIIPFCAFILKHRL